MMKATGDRKEKLNELFKALRSEGLVARQNFKCCGTCASYDLGLVLEEKTDKKGCAYYHQQDTPGINRGYVYIGYGGRPDVEGCDDTIEVGRAISDTAGKLKIPVVWDGFSHSRIRLELGGFEK
jgi:hypothetical protein